MMPVTPKTFLSTSHSFRLPDFLLQAPSRGIKTLELNQTVDTVFGLQEYKRAVSGAGKPYLDLLLFDATGGIHAKVWDSVDRIEQIVSVAPVIRVWGTVSDYPKGSGQLQITVKDVSPAPQIDPTSLMPLASVFYDVNDLLNQMVRLYETMEEPYRSLTLFGMESFWDKFCRAPAAKKHHHAWVGGLLVHTAQLATIVNELFSDFNPLANMLMTVRRFSNEIERGILDGEADSQADLDHMYSVIAQIQKHLSEGDQLHRDLCMAATFWHDLGKIGEYQYQTKIDMDEYGKYLGHIWISMQKLEETRNKSSVSHSAIFPLYHIVLSHHGKPEWGAVVKPQTADAWLFHFVDYVGSRS